MSALALFAIGGAYVATIVDWHGHPSAALAQVPSDAYFTSHNNDKVPYFAHTFHAKGRRIITSVQAGAWSSSQTWEGGMIPGSNDIAIIKHDVQISGSTEVYTVAIDQNGRLTFSRSQDTHLRVVNVEVLQGGTLDVGTVQDPIPATVTAEIIIRDVPLDVGTPQNVGGDPEQWGDGILALNGTVFMHGAIKQKTFVRMQEATAGQTSISLTEAVPDWRAGDRIVFPDTRQLRFNEVGSKYVPQWETATIAEVRDGGMTLVLTAPLRFAHRGAHDPNGTLTTLPEGGFLLPHVGNLTRNVIIRSDDLATSGGRDCASDEFSSVNCRTRGHTAFMNRSIVDIRFVSFIDLGRTTIDPLNNVVYSSTGALRAGTNQIGRYPVHAHHLIGPVSSTLNYPVTLPSGTRTTQQFIFDGNAIDGSDVTNSIKWGIALHSSHYGLVTRNVTYNVGGGAIVGEDGSESENVVDHNFAVRTFGLMGAPDSPQRADVGGGTAREGVGFWFHGPNNYIRNNVAANSASYGYIIFTENVANAHIPSAQGVDPMVSGRVSTMNDVAIPEFSRNETYGATPGGMAFWWIGARTNLSQPIGISVIKDTRVWHVHVWGYFGYPGSNHIYDGWIGRSDSSSPAQVGWWHGDYLAKNIILRNFDIRGYNAGIFAPDYTNDHGATTAVDTIIEDSVLQNDTNILIQTFFSSGGGGAIPPRRLKIRNISAYRLGSYNQPQYAIQMFYNPTNQSNVIQSNQVSVEGLKTYGYGSALEGQTLPPFDLYYEQQKGNFVIPQTSGDFIGSPEAGLTNDQNWAKYGIAIGGAIAPCANGSGCTNKLNYPFIKGLAFAAGTSSSSSSTVSSSSSSSSLLGDLLTGSLCVRTSLQQRVRNGTLQSLPSATLTVSTINGPTVFSGSFPLDVQGEIHVSDSSRLTPFFQAPLASYMIRLVPLGHMPVSAQTNTILSSCTILPMAKHGDYDNSGAVTLADLVRAVGFYRTHNDALLSSMYGTTFGIADIVELISNYRGG